MFTTHHTNISLLSHYNTIKPLQHTIKPLQHTTQLNKATTTHYTIKPLIRTFLAPVQDNSRGWCTWSGRCWGAGYPSTPARSTTPWTESSCAGSVDTVWWRHHGWYLAVVVQTLDLRMRLIFFLFLIAWDIMPELSPLSESFRNKHLIIFYLNEIFHWSDKKI